jgi:hypothetical protein
MTLIVRAGRVKTITRKRITQDHATQLADGLPVTAAVDYDGTVDLWADRKVTTLEEVHCLCTFMAKTDARLRWHEATR